jgi:phosphonate metabolism-associated iron-containing alcohol dehydrogenase
MRGDPDYHRLRDDHRPPLRPDPGEVHLSWRYHNPVRVCFGPGSLDDLSRILGDEECVVVTFPEARDAGIEERLEKKLGMRLREVIRDVAPNPDVEWFKTRYAAHWVDHADATLVAIGGGSVLDTAKVLQVGAGDGTFEELVAAVAAGKLEPTRARRLVAIPTTAGTGSEVTPWATLWDAQAGVKLSLHSDRSWPSDALVDPELTLSLPPLVTRNGALDALSHSLESIWNRNANPVSDMFAVEAARTVIATLPALLQNPKDIALRSAMSRGALIAGFAFSNTKTALAHSISYDMTLRHGLPHGLACSFTLPMVWRMAAGADAARDAVLAKVFPGEYDPPARLEAFLQSVDVSTRFEDYGVDEAEVREMIGRAAEGARGRNFIGKTLEVMP